MFRLQNPEYLWLLLVVLVLTIIYILSELVRHKRLKRIGDQRLVKMLMPQAKPFRRAVKFVFICLALVNIIIALARPQFGTKLSEVKQNGVEIITVIDVSNSMLAQDLKPNRLKNAKMFVERLIAKLNGNKLGMVIFAGDAFVQMPITTDVRSARLYLSTINTGDIPVQGTNIAKALELSARSFSSDEEASKVIILMTDGENHEEDAVEMAKLLKEQGIVVMSVGFGSPQGVPIQTKNGYFKDKNGNTVTTKLNEKTLIEIANATGGLYVRATNNSTSSDAILKELDKLQESETTKQVYSEFDEKYQYFIFLALFFFCLDLILLEKKNPFLQKIKLFKEQNH